MPKVEWIEVTNCEPDKGESPESGKGMDISADFANSKDPYPTVSAFSENVL